MSGLLFCGPCQSLWTFAANVVEMRRVGRLRLATASCPGCGHQVTVELSRPVWRALWRVWCRLEREVRREAGVLRGELESAGDRAAALIGGTDGGTANG